MTTNKKSPREWFIKRMGLDWVKNLEKSQLHEQRDFKLSPDTLKCICGEILKKEVMSCRLKGRFPFEYAEFQCWNTKCSHWIRMLNGEPYSASKGWADVIDKLSSPQKRK